VIRPSDGNPAFQAERGELTKTITYSLPRPSSPRRSMAAPTPSHRHRRRAENAFRQRSRRIRTPSSSCRVRASGLRRAAGALQVQGRLCFQVRRAARLSLLRSSSFCPLQRKTAPCRRLAIAAADLLRSKFSFRLHRLEMKPHRLRVGRFCPTCTPLNWPSGESWPKSSLNSECRKGVPAGAPGLRSPPPSIGSTQISHWVLGSFSEYTTNRPSRDHCLDIFGLFPLASSHSTCTAPLAAFDTD